MAITEQELKSYLREMPNAIKVDSSGNVPWQPISRQNTPFYWLIGLSRSRKYGSMEFHGGETEGTLYSVYLDDTGELRLFNNQSKKPENLSPAEIVARVNASAAQTGMGIDAFSAEIKQKTVLKKIQPAAPKQTLNPEVTADELESYLRAIPNAIKVDKDGKVPWQGIANNEKTPYTWLVGLSQPKKYGCIELHAKDGQTMFTVFLDDAGKLSLYDNNSKQLVNLPREQIVRKINAYAAQAGMKTEAFVSEIQQKTELKKLSAPEITEAELKLYLNGIEWQQNKIITQFQEMNYSIVANSETKTLVCLNPDRELQLYKVGSGFLPDTHISGTLISDNAKDVLTAVNKDKELRSHIRTELTQAFLAKVLPSLQSIGIQQQYADAGKSNRVRIAEAQAIDGIIEKFVSTLAKEQVTQESLVKSLDALISDLETASKQIKQPIFAETFSGKSELKKIVAGAIEEIKEVRQVVAEAKSSAELMPKQSTAKKSY
jgi:hypothetical protein